MIEEKELASDWPGRMNMLLHGFHFWGKEGTMAIILPHGVLFQGGSRGQDQIINASEHFEKGKILVW